MVKLAIKHLDSVSNCSVTSCSFKRRATTATNIWPFVQKCSLVRTHTHTHRVRGHSMRSSVELVCGCCLWANTDGLPICHNANTPQSLGHCVCLRFTVVAHVCGYVPECVKESVWSWENCLAPFPLLSSALFGKTACFCQTFHLDYWIVIYTNTKWHLSAAKDSTLIMWLTDQSRGWYLRRQWGWMWEERMRATRNRTTTRGKASFHHLITSHQWLSSRMYPSPRRSEKNPPCIIHKGIINDSSGPSPGESTQKYGENFLYALDTSWSLM